MDLWLISQDENRGYDTYDSAVVAADSEEEARKVNPGEEWDADSYFRVWCRHPAAVTVKHLASNYQGEAGVVLASFNAG